MRWLQIIILLLIASFAGAASLQWNASVVDEDHAAPTGYRIHRGTATGVYDWQIDVGNAIQWPIPDDLYGSFYWAASAYNSSGSSGYSNEVFWQRAPPEPPQYIGATNLRASKLQTIGNDMGFTHIASISHIVAATTTTVVLDSTLNVVAGDLLVCFANWEDGTATVSVSDGGSNSLTMKTPHAGGGAWGAMGYKIAASANATATFTMTLGTARPYKTLLISQFRPDAGETVTEDASNTGAGTSGTTHSSGTINTAGTDEVVIGAAKNYTGLTYTNEQIGGAAADGSLDEGNLSAIWYKIYTSTQSNIAASATGPSGDWVCDIIAFKSASGGGASVVPVFMLSQDHFSGGVH